MNENASAKKLASKLKSNKILEILLILIVIVVVAVVLYNVFGNKEEKTANVSADYGAQLEADLANALSEIEGAGKVSVMIAFSSEGETVIAMETIVREDGSIVTTPVLIDGEVVVLEVKKPEISGVLIIAEGADDLGVRFNLLHAAASVLDINQSLIKVYTKG